MAQAAPGLPGPKRLFWDQRSVRDGWAMPQSSHTHRPVSGWPQASCWSSKVDATLGTVVHRATAQLGLLLLVPALFTEIREEGCNLSTG